MSPSIVPSHVHCLLHVGEITSRARDERKVPYNLLRILLSTLELGFFGNWTLYFVHIFILINDAIIYACVIYYVRQIKRAHDLLRLFNTMRQHIPLWKKCANNSIDHPRLCLCTCTLPWCLRVLVWHVGLCLESQPSYSAVLVPISSCANLRVSLNADLSLFVFFRNSSWRWGSFNI